VRVFAGDQPCHSEEGLGRQIVDAHEGRMEGACALDPVLRHTQVIQARRQPIIGAIAWQPLLG
jgi:hypothetical protein